jgi:hypothetical protein
MYYTHHFAHRQNLSRARAWLTQLGFGPHQIEASESGIPRITVAAEPARFAEIRTLVNALERSDPDGFPSFWDEARHTPCASVPSAEPAMPAPVRAASVAIGWHPPDSTLASD